MNSNYREIGLHLRLKDSYTSIIKKAHKKKSNIFQMFLTPEKQTRYLDVDENDLDVFFKLKKYHSEIYVHSSYKINLPTNNKKIKHFSKYLLKKELDFLKKLNINYLVLHPGSANEYGRNAKDRGIKSLMDIINQIISETDVTLLLENTAHDNNNIGGSLKDFISIRKLVANPEKIKFCIDFAHAHVYGYDIKKTEEFIHLLDNTVGTENIKLIHFNDTYHHKGSKIDSHAPPGKGTIGKETLQNLMHHPKLRDIPMIIELPATAVNNSQIILEEVQTW